MNKCQIDDAEIDFSRGEISRDGETISVEPKVMAVLELLIQAKGEVVSQEQIFNCVWPGAVYSQSLIQRSIAVLRKAFGDDAKQQRVIQTHPKRGYRLNRERVHLRATQPEQDKRWPTKLALVSVPMIIVILLTIWWSTTGQDTPAMAITEAQQISATDAYESLPQYLGDTHISFIRDNGDNRRAVWLYDTQTELEHRVTKDYDNLVDYQWLEHDTLVFALRQGSIVTLFKATGLKLTTDSQLPNEKTTEPLAVIHDVERFRGFHITADNQLIYLAVKNNRSALVSRHLLSEHEQVLVSQSEQFNPYGFTVDAAESKIAASGFNQTLTTSVMVLDRETSQWLTWASLDSNIYQMNWHPSEPQILVTQGKQLFVIEQDKPAMELGYKSSKFITEPSFSSDGSKILLIEETIDADLWIDAIPSGSRAVIVNSTATDFGAHYSPNGNQLAFISTRKGFPQIYVVDIATQQTQVVFQNPERKMLIAEPVWHPSEAKLLTAVNEQLLLIDMTRDEAQLQRYEGTAVQPLGWYPDGQSALVENVANNKQLSKFNMDNGRSETLTHNSELGAVLDPQGHLILIAQNTLYRWHEGERKSIGNLNDNIVSYVAHTNGLYLMTSDNQHQVLSFFDWQTLSVEPLGALPDDVYVLWDVDPSGQSVVYETTVTHRNIVQLSTSH